VHFCIGSKWGVTAILICALFLVSSPHVLISFPLLYPPPHYRSAVPDYLDVIKEPIDLMTIEKRIRQDNHYKSKQMLFADLMLMVNNCKLYNDEASTYVQCATNLEKFIQSLFQEMGK